MNEILRLSEDGKTLVEVTDKSVKEHFIIVTSLGLFSFLIM